jgi:hypothetical protein
MSLMRLGCWFLCFREGTLTLVGDWIASLE